MYHLATVAPPVQRIKIPLARDQIMLLMAAVNLIFLGVDIYLAHRISGTIVRNEWIPIIFGPIGGLLLLVAGVIALRQRPLATVIAMLVLLASVTVGLLGVYFHLRRATLPTGPSGEQFTVRLLAWGPPFLGPLMFALVGLWGISAAWVEQPPDSGRLSLLFGQHLQMPLSKTRAYFLMFGLGTMVTTISSVLDHARTGFENPYLWIPTTVGVFATIVGVTLGCIECPTRSDLIVYVLTMGLLALTGLLGAVLHISDNLTARGAFFDRFMLERFIRGAPFLAPLLFANMGAMGLLILLDPRSETLK